MSLCDGSVVGFYPRPLILLSLLLISDSTMAVYFAEFIFSHVSSSGRLWAAGVDAAT
jgi:hypothetical protein